eukprot:Hpha_TRINITY_DN16853_c3_g2::TRINITY_DN16853_c3_g2_i1::g.150483::m.150483
MPAPDVEQPEGVLSARVLGLGKDEDVQEMFTWEDVTIETKKEKPLLHLQGGIARPGEMIAVMGPSGAGKSLLLNALAGRAPGVEVDGEFRINGAGVSAKELRARVGYVMQEDALLTTQTPEEILAFSAALRLGMSAGTERDELITNTLTLLGIEHVRDVPIGSTLDLEASEKGRVSGGQKKRVAIAQELLSRPGILLLDEPTSGLDSFTAVRLMSIVQEIARSGVAVVCTIHQPAPAVFALFDRVHFLSAGHLILEAPVPRVSDWLAKNGAPVPEGANPADCALEMLQSNDIEELLKMAETDTEIEILSPPKLPLPPLPQDEGGAGCCHALHMLLQRDARHKIRERTSLIARFGSTLLLNLLGGLIYFQAGKTWGADGDPKEISAAVQNHFGALFFLAVNTMMLNAQPPLVAFLPERPVFMREYACGTYGVFPYVLSKLLIEIPLLLVGISIGLGLQFALVGLQGDFHVLFLWLFLFSMAASAVSFLLGAAASNSEVAINLLPLMLVPQILFSGFLASTTSMPVWIRWVQWTCAMKYAMNLILLEEFDSTNVPASRVAYTSAVLERTDVNGTTDNRLFYAFVLLGLGIILRLATVKILRKRARQAYA